MSKPIYSFRAGALVLGIAIVGGLSWWGLAASRPEPAPVVDTPPVLDPAALYATNCSSCHDMGRMPRAPHSIQFSMIGPRQILEALETGVMKQQGSLLSAEERHSLAEYLGGAKLDASAAQAPVCDSTRAAFDFDRPPPLNGWGMGTGNQRHVPAAVARLPAKEIPHLKLKWAFAFDGASRARSQPTVGGGAIYVGSQDGTVYALDFDTGCVRWSRKGLAEVRTSPVLESWTSGDRSAKPKLFVADFRGNAYALDASNGRLLWTVQVDGHPYLTLTGSPRLHDGRLYVPMSSNEWAAAADPSYECCSFRGGVVALDAANGNVLWRSYSIPDAPQPQGLSSAGARRLHPAGAPIWNTPSVDERRRRLYVGTGQAYTEPAAPQSDAVLALDMDSGKLLWSHQALAGDVWNMACLAGPGPNCPQQQGPDFDIGAATILYRPADGREVLLAGQKSGHVFALDPDDGRLLWKQRLGRGGLSGGVHWGMAVADSNLYVPIADTTMIGDEQGEARPGLNALDPSSGRTRWFAPAPDICLPERKPSCDPGYSAPPTAIDGAVFAPSYDGHLRAYAAGDGRLLWDVDTTVPVRTVSGDVAHGGSIEAVGAIVVDGRVIVPSGYLFGSRMAGNVLLVYGTDDESSAETGARP